MFPEHDNQVKIQVPLAAFKATTDPDTMYHHEAMREPDKAEFMKAMAKEVKDQMENGNFPIVKKIEVPKDKPFSLPYGK